MISKRTFYSLLLFLIFISNIQNCICGELVDDTSKNINNIIEADQIVENSENHANTDNTENFLNYQNSLKDENIIDFSYYSQVKGEQKLADVNNEKSDEIGTEKDLNDVSINNSFHDLDLIKNQNQQIESNINENKSNVDMAVNDNSEESKILLNIDNLEINLDDEPKLISEDNSDQNLSNHDYEDKVIFVENLDLKSPNFENWSENQDTLADDFKNVQNKDADISENIESPQIDSNANLRNKDLDDDIKIDENLCFEIIELSYFKKFLGLSFKFTVNKTLPIPCEDSLKSEEESLILQKLVDNINTLSFDLDNNYYLTQSNNEEFLKEIQTLDSNSNDYSNNNSPNDWKPSIFSESLNDNSLYENLIVKEINREDEENNLQVDQNQNGNEEFLDSSDSKLENYQAGFDNSDQVFLKNSFKYLPDNVNEQSSFTSLIKTFFYGLCLSFSFFISSSFGIFFIGTFLGCLVVYLPTKLYLISHKKKRLCKKKLEQNLKKPYESI